MTLTTTTEANMQIIPKTRKTHHGLVLGFNDNRVENTYNQKSNNCNNNTCEMHSVANIVKIPNTIYFFINYLLLLR